MARIMRRHGGAPTVFVGKIGSLLLRAFVSFIERVAGADCGVALSTVTYQLIRIGKFNMVQRKVKKYLACFCMGVIGIVIR